MVNQNGKLSKAACVVIMLSLAYMLFVRIMLIFSYSLDLDGAEFAFVHLVQVLLQGHTLYRDPGQAPYCGVLFTPAYLYALYALSKLCRLNEIADIHYIYVLGRALSMLAFIINLFVLDRFISLFNKNVVYRIFAIALFVFLQSSQIFSARPDSFQLLFFTLFVYFIFRYYFVNPALRWILYAFLFALLAIFSKQDSAISIFLFLGLFCLYDRSVRAFSVLVSFIVILAVCLALAYLIFGRFFFTNTFIYNFQVLTGLKKTYVLMALAYSLVRLLPLTLAVAVMAFWDIKDNRRRSPALFMAALAMCYFVITHVLVLRAGSWINYTFSAILLLVVSFSMLLKQNLQRVNQIRNSLYVVMGLYLAGLFLLNYLFPGYIHYSKEKEVLNKQKYYALQRSRNEVSAVTKNEVIFFLNPTYNLFFADKPVIGGVDMHQDRAIEMVTGFQVHTKLLLVSIEKYDALFSTGTVQYIVAEDDDRSKRQLKNYYGQYHFFTKTGFFSLYKYDAAPI